ncbi:MAG: hydantoinase/oxoprolinase family protein [Candidatus Thorarchaeota archaeon]
MRVVGLDIGGANLKGCGLTIDESGNLQDQSYSSDHFPVWLHERAKLWDLISRTVSKLSGNRTPDLVSIVMTAELSDTFETKRDGVVSIVEGISSVIANTPVVYPSIDLELLQPQEALDSPLSVAAANWPVLAWAVGRDVSDCILIDVGSTTTDVLPIRDGFPATIGKDDTSRLISGELVYTGVLRTDVSAILRSVSVEGESCRVSSEHFATSGDVHLVLGHIAEDQYTIETADNRGKSPAECKARLARVLCGDIETLSDKVIVDIARQAWIQQLDDIGGAVLQICRRMSIDPKEEIFVFSGIGAEFLGYAAVTPFGVTKATYLKDVLGVDGSIVATAYSAALYAGTKWRNAP